MKTSIACYSATGNTLKVAEAVRDAAGADLVRIEAQPPGTCLNGYDAFVVCSPVNMNSAPPEVSEFLARLGSCEGKKYGIVITYMWAGEPLLARMRDALDKTKASNVDSLLVRQGSVADGSYPGPAKAFAARFK